MSETEDDFYQGMRLIADEYGLYSAPRFTQLLQFDGPDEEVVVGQYLRGVSSLFNGNTLAQCRHVESFLADDRFDLSYPPIRLARIAEAALEDAIVFGCIERCKALGRIAHKLDQRDLPPGFFQALVRLRAYLDARGNSGPRDPDRDIEAYVRFAVYRRSRPHKATIALLVERFGLGESAVKEAARRGGALWVKRSTPII